MTALTLPRAPLTQYSTSAPPLPYARSRNIPSCILCLPVARSWFLMSSRSESCSSHTEVRGASCSCLWCPGLGRCGPCAHLLPCWTATARWESPVLLLRPGPVDVSPLTSRCHSTWLTTPSSHCQLHLATTPTPRQLHLAYDNATELPRAG